MTDELAPLPPFLGANGPLHSLVVKRQRELENELFELLRSADEQRGVLERNRPAYNVAGLASQTEIAIEQKLGRVADIERRLQVYDRLALRPWERTKGWLSIAALAISMLALGARFLGHGA